MIRLGPTDSDKMAVTSRAVALDYLANLRIDAAVASSKKERVREGGNNGYQREQVKERLLFDAEIVCATLAGAGMEFLIANTNEKSTSSPRCLMR